MKNLVLLFLSFCCSVVFGADSKLYKPQTRIYYLAAETVEWDYAPSGKDLHTGMSVPDPWGKQTKYKKVRYIEYTDDSFSKKKPQPPWLGIMGPVIRGVEGDTIKVVFLNRAKQSYSVHPHGVLYDKDNEGATHAHDGEHSGHTMKPYGADRKGSQVMPNQKYTYTWTVTSKAAPGPRESSSKVWMYHSHVRSPQDVFDGLIGPIIITSKAHATAEGSPKDVEKEFVNLFMIWDETKEGMKEEEKETHLKHGINGYIFANLQGLEMKKGDRVRWHLIGMGNEADIHTPHWHGEIVESEGRNTDVIELLPASMKTVDMKAENVGEWMYHCHVSDHIKAGMMTSYFIKP
jgi:manganese oxidase